MWEENGTDEIEMAEASATSDVFEPRLHTEGFEKIPHCVYFFYIGEKIPGTTYNKILHYYDPGDDQPIDTPAKLEAKVAALIRNAREPNTSNQYPPPIGAAWNYVVMDRISYVAFAFDFAMTSGPEFAVYHGEDPNHSFFDAALTNLEGCPVVYCVNHMKRAPGGIALGQERQEFRFELITVPAITWEGMPLLPDSGGTNTGGGVPPP